jgi:hypothetical protein
MLKGKSKATIRTVQVRSWSEQLFRAPAWRVFREQTLVHAERIDSVPAVGDRVCGDRDDLPALVACATRSAEVHADDSVGGG